MGPHHVWVHRCRTDRRTGPRSGHIRLDVFELITTDRAVRAKAMVTLNGQARVSVLRLSYQKRPQVAVISTGRVAIVGLGVAMCRRPQRNKICSRADLGFTGTSKAGEETTPKKQG